MLGKIGIVMSGMVVIGMAVHVLEDSAAAAAALLEVFEVVAKANPADRSP